MEYLHAEYKHTPYLKTVPQDKSPELYNEEYYNNGTLYQSNFEIPHNCKKEFENNIRSLGIDELIFGDIDAVCRQLKFQVENNRIRNVQFTKNEFSYTQWERKLSEEFFCRIENIDDLFNHEDIVCICESDVIVRIKSSRDNTFGVLVEGEIYLSVKPNFMKFDKVLIDLNSRENNLYEKTVLLLHLAFNFIRHWDHHMTIKDDFKAIIYADDSRKVFRVLNMNLGLSERTKAMVERSNSDFEERYFPKYKELIKHISTEDIEALKKIEINSDEFKVLVEKYKAMAVDGRC